MKEQTTVAQAIDWDSPWFDGIAFFSGLVAAWYWGWETKDLIWSLWLSSLVVGYAIIMWGILVRIRQTRMVMGGLILLVFLTLHFGLFHFVHSVFLNTLFPLSAETGVPQMASYVELLTGLWWFLPAALIAERSGFREIEESTTGHPINVMADAGSGFMKPYRNVFRMHALIFFFILAHWAKIENIAVYVVVYAVYFFPWRQVFEQKSERRD